jgi:hypothetical protein
MPKWPAASLAGLGDHRIHEYEHPHGSARADKRRREASQRLSNEDNIASFRDRVDDDVGIRRETSVPVVARQIDRDGFVPRRAKEGNHAVPIPGHAARPGDEYE